MAHISSNIFNKNLWKIFILTFSPFLYIQQERHKIATKKKLERKNIKRRRKQRRKLKYNNEYVKNTCQMRNKVTNTYNCHHKRIRENKYTHSFTHLLIWPKARLHFTTHHQRVSFLSIIVILLNLCWLLIHNYNSDWSL